MFELAKVGVINFSSTFQIQEHGNCTALLYAYGL
jgi:hypothetical protein